jgi:membrane associated rhomboid family serine protease
MEQLSLTLIIVIVTSILSYRAFQSPVMLGKWMFIPFQVKNYREYHRILSHAFVHGDMMHLIFNMFALYSFGELLEKALAILRTPGESYMLYSLIYFGGIAVATLPSMLKHHDNASYRSLGASGGVSSVLMATMLLFPESEIGFFFFIPMKAYLAIPLFFIIEHWMQRSGKTGIAHDAHIGGALFGLLAMIAIEPKVLSNFIAVVFG